jgi:2-amino-4-hydroxy-6-hydroxymethyldihydropteridine diphosphokinase
MDVVIGLGSNLGDRKTVLASAALGLRAFVDVTAVSSLYESKAVGPPQPDYLNAGVRGFYPGADAAELLVRLLELERAHGRERRERWGPRTLDLDILWISNVEVSLPDLTVPHRHLGERAFALLPLLDVAPEALHPRTGEPLQKWLEALDPRSVRKISGPDWTAWQS